MTVKQFASAVGVSRRTVMRYLERGIIEGKRRGVGGIEIDPDQKAVFEGTYRKRGYVRKPPPVAPSKEIETIWNEDVGSQPHLRPLCARAGLDPATVIHELERKKNTTALPLPIWVAAEIERMRQERVGG